MNSVVPPALAALEPLSGRDWFVHVERGLRSLGMRIDIAERRLRAWKSTVKAGDITFADGWQFDRLWLAPGRACLSVTAQRMYFDGATRLSLREQDILAGVRPPGPGADVEVARQWELLHELSKNLPGNPSVVNLAPVMHSLVRSREIGIGEKQIAFRSGTLNAAYRQVGFDEVPHNWLLTTCPLDGVKPEVAAEFTRRFSVAAEQRFAFLNTKVTSAEIVEAWIDRLPVDALESRHGRCLLFVLPSSEHPPSPASFRLLERLEARRVPFRRAYADDPLDYSVPDQIPSILLGSGGRPHRVTTATAAGPIWTLAVDLGHPRAASHSVLVATLVDPQGGLVHAARTVQRRDETATAPAIRGVLAACASAPAFLDAKDRQVLVVRDGRLFENESPADYLALFGESVSVVEYRKRGNPQVFLTHPSLRTPTDEFAVEVPHARTMFVCLARPRDATMLPGITKITWDKAWNRLELSPATIARVLASSAAAPGLGLHPRHLPAAVYWADGIAGVSPTDIRFLGVPCQEVRSS